MWFFSEQDVDSRLTPASKKLSRFGRRGLQQSETEIFRKVLRSESGAEAGPSTVIIRTALNKAFHQRTRRYRICLGGVALLAIVFGVVAWMQYIKVESLKETATEMFFTMKTMELGIAKLENLVVGQPT